MVVSQHGTTNSLGTRRHWLTFRITDHEQTAGWCQKGNLDRRGHPRKGVGLAGRLPLLHPPGGHLLYVEENGQLGEDAHAPSG